MTFATLVLDMTTMFHSIFQQESLFSWILVGLIAGFVAGALVRGRSYGCIGNIIVGLIGSFIGACVANALHINARFSFWGSVCVSIVGAVILLVIISPFTGRR